MKRLFGMPQLRRIAEDLEILSTPMIKKEDEIIREKIELQDYKPFDKLDLERVRTLAEAMPPNCRAFQGKDESQLQLQLQLQLPADLVLSFVNRTVDAFIRKTWCQWDYRL